MNKKEIIDKCIESYSRLKNLKIEADISNVLSYIKDLNAGDTFIYYDNIYILSDQFDDRDDSQLAVMLSNGVGKHLTPKTQVKPVHTKAVLVL